MANVPPGWIDNGTALTAPNGIKVVLGFREHILSRTWEPANVPLAPEAGANPVELGFSQKDGNNAGTRQIFMYSELCYTKARGVWNATVGREFWTLLNEKLPTTPSPALASTTTTKSAGGGPAEPEAEASEIKRELMATERMIGDTATHLLKRASQL